MSIFSWYLSLEQTKTQGQNGSPVTSSGRWSVLSSSRLFVVCGRVWVVEFDVYHACVSSSSLSHPVMSRAPLVV